MKIKYKCNDYANKDAAKIGVHIKNLTSVKECNTPFFSFYLDSENAAASIEVVKSWSSRIEKTLPIQHREYLRTATIEALKALSDTKNNKTKTEVLFLRYGDEPFDLRLSFANQAEVSLSCDSLPNISPLIEFKDSYDRYLVTILSSFEARIVEIKMGEVTSELWLTQPDARESLGRELSKLHYQKHRNDKLRGFISDSIESLKKVIRIGNYKNIILAGPPKIIGEVRKKLPSNIQHLVIDETNIDINQNQESIVAKTIQQFIQQEKQESQETLKQLQTQVLNEETAILGLQKVEAAVQNNMVDVLVVTKLDYSDSPFRIAPNSKATITERRNDIIRKAAAQNCKIEFVEENSFLNDFEGIGALLKYRFSLAQIEWLGHPENDDVKAS